MLNLKPGIGTKEFFSKNVAISAANVEALEEIAPPRCRTAAVNLGIAVLHAIVSGNPAALGEIGTRLYLALPDTMSADQLCTNLDKLSRSIKWAKLWNELRRLATEEEVRE